MTPPAAVADASWERTATALPENVGDLRHAIVAFAALHGADTDTQEDIALASSEALTNAVVHGFVGRAPGTLRVIAETVGSALTVRVIDDGCGVTPRLDSPGLGLGMSMMALLAVSVDISSGVEGRGTEARLVFAVPV